MDNIICVVGPTASGKTALAIRLAREYDGEIVSCDSMQVYRRMNVGTAKPTAEERAAAVHHMIDVAEPDEDYSVGKYVQAADACIRQILSRGKTVIVVGGTGLYADSLIAGRAFAPIPSTGKRKELERRADEEGTEALLRELSAIDPETAARLHPADRKRIIRALEVFSETGMTISRHNELTKLQPPRYEPLWLGLDYADRADLYDRIDRRVLLMREAGLDEEVRLLLSDGVPDTATSMQAIGYKELVMAEKGECSREDAYALIARRSRNYAKRQLTWFRGNDTLHWLVRTAEQTDDELFEAARRETAGFARR